MRRLHGPEPRELPTTTMPPTIHPAKPSDFLPVAALDRIAWLHLGETFIPDGEHVWRVWCEYATVLVARHDDGGTLGECGEVAGAVVMFPTGSAEQFLHKIMVHPTLRGDGIGTALMRAALKRATQPVLLTVDPANDAAVQLYRNFGFEVHKQVKGYYRPHEDRCLMMFRP